MTVCSTTALRKYLTQHSNLGQPSREKAVSTTRAHAEGETIINSGRYRRPLFKSSITPKRCRRAAMKKMKAYIGPLTVLLMSAAVASAQTNPGVDKLYILNCG